ncbi:MAG: hypothetical protein EPN93_01950 [Spirochaetes bacterium]|nr:MAG: hypothetical protein EPN93_01950 [Spirochaetota bacterium]
MKFTAMLALVLAGISCAQPASVGDEYYRRGVELYLKKDLAGAREYFSRSLECRGSRPGARVFLAKISYFQGEDAEFESQAERCLENEETKSEGLRLKARWHLRRGEYAAAKETVTKLLARSGEDTVGLYIAGSASLGEGDHEEAIIAFTRATSAYPYLQQSHRKLEEIYTKLGLAARARKNRAMAAAITEWEKEEK